MYKFILVAFLPLRKQRASEKRVDQISPDLLLLYFPIRIMYCVIYLNPISQLNSLLLIFCMGTLLHPNIIGTLRGKVVTIARNLMTTVVGKSLCPL